jgi:hypothetical protein
MSVMEIPTLLSSRPLLGWPGIRVELHTRGRHLEVQIHDSVGLTTWKPVTRAEAKDMYFHPFVYGYNAPDLATSTEEG